MKVLHIITTLNSGGAEKMLVDIVEKMMKNDIEVEVLVLSHQHDFYSDRFRMLGVPVHFGKVDQVYHFSHINTIRKFILRGFDFIHAHLFASQLFVSIAKKMTFSNVKLITTEHSTHNKRREMKLFKPIDYWMYTQFDKIIAITNGTKEELNNYLPSTLNKTLIIENGIKLEDYKNADSISRTKLVDNYNEGDILVLMVAAMREQKDHETVIRASKLLPENYHVLFVGEGERMNEVRVFAENYGSSKIHFLGRRSDIASIMKSSDVFVLSSHWEGFGLVALEALAAGLPVIVSNVAGLREVVNDNNCLFKVGDEKELSKKIKFFAYSGTRKNLVDLNRFSIEHTVNKYIQTYREL